MKDDEGSESGVEPRLSEQLSQFWEKLKSGEHSGEPFDLTITARELEEALAWYAVQHSGFPLGEAQVSVSPEGIEVSGEARVGTLQVPLEARADVSLHDGVPAIAVDQLRVGELGLPDFVRFQLEDQLNKQLMLGQEDLPVQLDEVDLQEGLLRVRGTIR
jgi:hypothetical protein